MADETVFICSDGNGISYNLWLPASNLDVRYFVHILHDLGDHSKRYASFARYLNQKGIGVLASDFRGHGNSARNSIFGFFAEKDGWNRIVMDQYELACYISSTYRGVPSVLIGNGLGAVVAMNMAMKFPEFYSGMMLIGPLNFSVLQRKIWARICSEHIASDGAKAGAVEIDKRTFMKFNRQFAPNKTDFDWLSSEEKELLRFANDPLCGNLGTYGLMADVLHGLEIMNNKSEVAGISKDLPVLIYYGENDNVGKNGKAAKSIAKLLHKTGLNDITVEEEPNARHALLFEKNKAGVYNRISSWMDERL